VPDSVDIRLELQIQEFLRGFTVVQRMLGRMQSYAKATNSRMDAEAKASADRQKKYQGEAAAYWISHHRRQEALSRAYSQAEAMDSRRSATAQKKYEGEASGHWLSLHRRQEALSRAQAQAEVAEARRTKLLKVGFRQEEYAMMKDLKKREEDAAKKVADAEVLAAKRVAKAHSDAIRSQQRTGAIAGAAGRAGGQMAAGVRGGLGGVWLLGSGFSGLASAAGMAIPKLAGLFGILGGVANIAANVASIFITWTQALVRASIAAAQFVGSSLVAIARTAWNVAGAIGRATIAIGRATIAIGRFVGRTVLAGLQSLWGTLSRIGAAAQALVMKLGLVAVAAGVAAAAAGTMLVKSWVTAYSQAETFLAKMEVAFKSRSLAQAWFDWARKTAMTTPFTTEEVVDSITRLALYGAQKFGTLTEWFKLTGDMAGAMGRSISDAVEAVVDVIYGGGMERIKEFGINSFELIQRGAVRAPGGGVKRTNAKEIGALVKALKSVMIDKFGGGMEKLRQTLKGLASDLTDFVWIIKSALGGMLAPAIRVFIPYIKTLLDAFTAWVVPLAEKWAPKIEEFAKKMVAALEAARSWIESKMPVIIAWFQKVRDAIKAWIGDQGGWSGIWKKISGFAKGLWGAVTDVVSAIKVWVKEQGGLEIIWKKVKKFANNIGQAYRSVRDALLEAWPQIKATLLGMKAQFLVWLEGKGGLSGLWKGIVDSATRIWGAVTGNFVPALKYLGSMIAWVANRWTGGKGLGDIGSGFESLVNWVAWAVTQITMRIPGLVAWLEWGWQLIQRGLDWIQVQWAKFITWFNAHGGMDALLSNLQRFADFLRGPLWASIQMVWLGIGEMLSRITGVEWASEGFWSGLDKINLAMQKVAAFLPTFGSLIKVCVVNPLTQAYYVIKLLLGPFGTLMASISGALVTLDAFRKVMSGEMPGSQGAAIAFKAAKDLENTFASQYSNLPNVGGSMVQQAKDAAQLSTDMQSYQSGETLRRMQGASGAQPSGTAKERKVTHYIVPPPGFTITNVPDRTMAT
jgi:hypothetical protein